MQAEQNDLDLKTKAVVDGLVAEGFDLFFKLSRNYEPPKKNEVPVDDIDRNWKLGQGASLKLSDRRKICLAIPDHASPPHYRKPFADFKKGLKSLTLPEQLYPVVETSIDAFIGNFGELEDSDVALVQNELKAAQATVNDLFDGYLSRKDSAKVGGRKDETKIPPPLIHFAKGNKPFTQKTYFYEFPFDVCLIGFPRYLAKGGIALWTALAHESGGHAVLNGYPDLSVNLRKTISTALGVELKEKGYFERDVEQIIAFWMSRFEEAVSDCLGILTLGPAMAFGLLARGPLEKEYWPKEPESNEHPSLLLRCHLAACTVGNLNFSGAKPWKESMLRFMEANLQPLPLDETPYWNLDMWMVRQDKRNEAAKISAEIFSRILVKGSMEHLSGNPLDKIQNWYESDENTAKHVAGMLIGPQGSFKVSWEAYCKVDGSNTYPAHVVAASVYALADQDDKTKMGIRRNVFQNMVYALTKIKPENDYLVEFEHEYTNSDDKPSAAPALSGMAPTRKSPNNGSLSGARGVLHAEAKA